MTDVRRYLSLLSGGGSPSTEISEKYLTDVNFHTVVNLAASLGDPSFNFGILMHEQDKEIFELRRQLRAMKLELEHNRRMLQSSMASERRHRDTLADLLIGGGQE